MSKQLPASVIRINEPFKSNKWSKKVLGCHTDSLVTAFKEVLNIPGIIHFNFQVHFHKFNHVFQPEAREMLCVGGWLSEFEMWRQRNSARVFIDVLRAKQLTNSEVKA
jgi:hypothetical protein